MENKPVYYSKGGVYLMTYSKHPLVRVAWKEGDTFKVKNFCINKSRTEEEAKQMATEFYEANVLPNYKLWRAYKDESMKQRKRDYDTTKYTCDCGSTTSRVNKPKHERTMKHLTFISIRDNISMWELVQRRK